MAQIRALRAKEKTTFTDAEITNGFFKLAFGAEMHRGGRVDRIRKYQGPVRVYIDNRANPNRASALERVIADIGSRIEALDIAVTESRSEANMLVTLVADRDLAGTISRVYGQAQGRRILRSLDPQCLSSFRKDSSFRIIASTIILAADTDDFTFLDCAFEEILQALGPINDVPSIPWTMFNDDVQMGYFGTYDQYILNILYDPAIKPGMRMNEVRAVLPLVLQRVRLRLSKKIEN